MELEVLREYITLTQTLNYTKAAEALHLTQPTLSKHIVSLERELGCSLFKRDRRHVELTDAGTVFASAAMQMIDSFDEAKMRIGELENADPIRVNGILTDASVSAIISIAAMILDQEGHAPVVYGGMPAEYFGEQLLDGEIDIAINSADLESLDADGLAYIPLARSQFVALVSLDCPLAKAKYLSIDDLRNYRFVKFADSFSINGWVDIERVCRDHGFTPRTRPVLGRNQANYTAVALDSEDVMILQQNMPQLRFLSDFSRMAVIPIIDDDACFKLFALYRKDDVERVKPVLDAYMQARKVILSHGKDHTLVESD